MFEEWGSLATFYACGIEYAVLHEGQPVSSCISIFLGGGHAERAESRDQDMEALQQKMQSLPPEQQQAAGMAMFMEMRERLHAEHPLDPASMPPEAAIVFEALQEKMRAAEQQARDTLAGLPLNPEIQRLLRKISDPDAAGSSRSES